MKLAALLAVLLAAGPALAQAPDGGQIFAASCANCHNGAADSRAPAIDAALRAYSTGDGTILWQYDTNREFGSINGVPAKGASLIGPGPVVAGGMVYINSGYGGFGGRPGNVLLAFGLESTP